MNRQQRRAAERRSQRTGNVSYANSARRTAEEDETSLLSAAVAHLQGGRLAEAAAACRRVLAVNPHQADALHLAGVVELQAGGPSVAVDLIALAIQHNDRNAGFFCHYGDACADLGRLEQAIGSYDRAIALYPAYAEAYANRGDALARLGRFDAAVTSYDQAIAFEPDYAEAWCNRGNPLRSLGRLDDAVASYDRAVALRPDFAEAWSNRASALLEWGRTEDAIANFDRAIALRPALTGAWYNRGTALGKIGERQAAIASYDRAIALQPNHAEAWSNRGLVLFEMQRVVEAVTCFDRAIKLNPDLAEAWYGRGNALQTLGHFADAMASFAQAVVLKPCYPEAQSELIHVRYLACEWRSRDADDAALLDLVDNGATVAPFVMLATRASPADQLRCARRWAGRFFRSPEPLFGTLRHDPARRLTVGYLSGDFRQHPLAHLIVDLLRAHDRERFEVIGYSVGPDDGSAIRSRIVDACDRYIELQDVADLSAAQLIARDQVDILVDLSGHTSGARTGMILAHRPAPIQASYLGYIGSMGADFIDYVIADEVALPMEQQCYYDEKIVHLPVCYQPNGKSREMSSRQVTRSEFGLPEHGFVFCCFNTSYKITPEVFATWMRLLTEVPDSVLWLVGTNPLAEANLRREAAARGIAVERLVFAAPVGYADHLARYQVADLFLDTLPYGAGATASDALWAGLPLLTRLGASFAGRMAASVLTAAGLPELITETESDYEAVALRLANCRDMLATLRARLRECRHASTLYDVARSARHLESAFVEMLRRHSNGEAPAPFAIPQALRASI